MQQRTSQGFTLIELLIYTGIIAIVGTLLGGVLLNVTKIQNKETASSEVNQQLDFVLQSINRLVRESSVVDIAGNSATSTLVLRMKDSAKDPTVIYLNNGKIFVKEGLATTTPLVNSAVTVDSLSFLKISTYPGHDSVQVDMAISYNNVGNLDKKSTQNISSAIARVSAATFDASLIPGATNNYDIGLSSNRWKDVYMSGRLTLGSLAADPVGVDGMLYYNTALASFRGYKNGAWANLGDSYWLATTSGRIYNGNSGNVGIGTNDPTATLSLYQSTSPGVYLDFEGNGGNYANMGLGQISGTPFTIWAQQGISINTDPNRNIVLGARETGSTGNINVFVTPDGGKVGVGGIKATTTLQALLQVGTGNDVPITTSPAVYVSNNGSTNLVVRDSINDVETKLSSISGSGNVGTVSNRSFNIATNNTTRISITSGGNVGIGTIGAVSPFHVANGFYAQFENNTAGPPPAVDCDDDTERGRISIDTSNNRLYVCNGALRGWDYAALSD